MSVVWGGVVVGGVIVGVGVGGVVVVGVVVVVVLFKVGSRDGEVNAAVTLSSSMSGLVQVENRIRGVDLLEPKRDGEVVEAKAPWDAGRRMLEVCKDGETVGSPLVAREGAPFCFCPGTGKAMCERFKSIAFPGCCCSMEVLLKSSEAESMS